MDRRILGSLKRIEQMLWMLIHEEREMASALDQLELDVAAEGTVIDSAVVLLNGLKAALDAAIASGDMSKVVAVNAELEAKTKELSDAVVANTPPTP